jgi:hypothetical protein
MFLHHLLIQQLLQVQVLTHNKREDISSLYFVSHNNNDHNEDTIFIRVRTSPFFKSLIEYYRISRLYFENQSIKNNCMKYLLKYLQ